MQLSKDHLLKRLRSHDARKLAQKKYQAKRYAEEQLAATMRDDLEQYAKEQGK